MRSRRSDPDRREVVAHRLSLLAPVPGSAEAAPRASDPVEAAWWADHTRVRDTRPSAAPHPPVGPTVHQTEDPPHDPPGDRADGWPGDVVRPATRLPAPAAAHPVPVPGRHASRRPRARPALPTGPLLLAPTHLAVLAVLVALGLALTSWWVVRSDPVPVAAPITPGPGATGSPLALLEPPGTPTSTSATAEAALVVVDVAGRVRRPGVVELPAGSRVVDALEAAGGVRGGVDLSGLNLARVLVDGEQVLVGAPSGPAAPPLAGTVPGNPGATAPTALVDLNTADQAALEALPDIGPVTAQAILAWRTEHGGFTAVQELLEVDGIGPATLETLAPLVTV